MGTGIVVLVGFLVLVSAVGYLRDRWWQRRWNAAGLAVDRYNADQKAIAESRIGSLVNEHRSAISEREHQDRVRVQAADDRHTEVVSQLNAAKHDAAESAQRAAAEIEGLTEQLRRHIDQGDLAARDRLVTACRAVGLSQAVVLSNLVFKPIDSHSAKPYYAQVDHLVVAPSGVLVVENKYWDAVVLDGAVPGTGHLTKLLTDSEIADVQAGRTVLRVARSHATAQITVHRHGGSSGKSDLTPARQASLQAQRLRDLLHESQVQCRWVQACVFYSHSRGTVTYKAEQGKALIAADQAALETVIRSTLGGSRYTGDSSVSVDAVVKVLSPLAGSVTSL